MTGKPVQAPYDGLRGPLDTSGPTPLAHFPDGDGIEYVRLWVREDGVVVALPMLVKPPDPPAPVDEQHPYWAAVMDEFGGAVS